MRSVAVSVLLASGLASVTGSPLVKKAAYDAYDFDDESDACAAAAHLSFSKLRVSEKALGGVNMVSTGYGHASIRYNDVLPESALNIDLVVTAMTDYFGDSQKNTVHGDFAAINVNAGSNATLKFAFVDRVTGNPVVVPPFYFTVANLGRFDDELRPGGIKSFSACNFVTSDIAAETNISTVVDDESGCTSFTSNFLGKLSVAAQLPPERSLAMGATSMANSVSLLYPSVSEFTLTLMVDEGLDDRTFMFSGSSNLVCPAKAICETMTCPEYSKLTRRAQDLYCEGEVCTEEADSATCCILLSPKDCSPNHRLSISEETLAYANLGGLGPDVDVPHEIRFRDVFGSGEDPTDLVITNISTYYPGPTAPAAFLDKFLTFDVANDTSVVLSFAFIDSAGNKTHPPTQFTLGVYDLDTGAGGVNAEEIEVNRFINYRVAENTTVRVLAEGDAAIFGGTAEREEGVEPVDPNNLTQDDLDKSVALDYSAFVTDFQLTIRVRGGMTTGRVKLTGWSAATCPGLGSYCASYTCPAGFSRRDDDQLRCSGPVCTDADAHTCCEAKSGQACGRAKRLQFTTDALVQNNLGGVGPTSGSKVMRIVDVFPEAPEKVEMRVSTSGKYETLEPTTEDRSPANDLVGGFLKIDVRCGTKLVLNLELFDMETNLLRPSDFHLTIASLDKGKGGRGTERVTATGFSYYNISKNSSVKVWPDTSHRGNNKATFVGSLHAAFPREVPSSTLSLDAKQLSRAVSLKYAGTASVQLELTVSSGPGYRSFMIGGGTSLACPVKLGLCNTLVCPPRYRLKTSAASLTCRDAECTVKDDVDTCCDEVSVHNCDPEATFSLSPASLVFANLGGMGPHHGKEQKLIFSDVFPGRSNAVDLEVRNSTPYAYLGGGTTSGMQGAFGSIILGSGSSNEFQFQFVERDSRKPVTDINEFLLTFVDLQADLDSTSGVVMGHTHLQIPMLRSFFLSDRSNVRYDGGRFVASSFATTSRTPMHPWAMTSRDMHTSVAMKLNSSTFRVKVDIPEGPHAAREILFAGPTNLLCPARAYCSSLACPPDMTMVDGGNVTACIGSVCTEEDYPTCCRYDACSEKHDLDLSNLIYNNLGGYGPDADVHRTQDNRSIIYGNVFPNLGATVNLVVELKPGTTYYPYAVERNGRIGPFGNINVRAGTHADVSFRFRDAYTNQPYQVPKFFFTFSGVDEQYKSGVESVTIYGFEWYKISKPSALKVEMMEGGATFTANEHGGTEGNLRHPLALPGAMLNHTMTVQMPSVEHFHVTIHASQGWTGRNIIFSGRSNLVCGKKPTCLEVTCLPGHRKRTDAQLRVCSNSHCYQERDHD